MDPARAEVRLVEWVDSAETPRWIDPDDLNFAPARVVTVGWVLHEDDQQVVLVQSIDTTHDNVNAVMAIPKVAITSSTTIRQEPERPLADDERPGFVHNVIAHPLLVLGPPIGEWLHGHRWAPEVVVRPRRRARP